MVSLRDTNISFLILFGSFVCSEKSTKEKEKYLFKTFVLAFHKTSVYSSTLVIVHFEPLFQKWQECLKCLLDGEQRFLKKNFLGYLNLYILGQRSYYNFYSRADSIDFKK